MSTAGETKGNDMHHIQVIVSQCSFHNGQWSLCGDPIQRSKHGSPREALETALVDAIPGQLVIIRPSFNETLDGIELFREWRSFDGQNFTEIRWHFRVGESSSLECKDGEIKLPEIPVEVKDA